MAQSVRRQGNILEVREEDFQNPLAEKRQQLDVPQLREVIDRLSPSVFVGLLAADGTLIYANRAALNAIGARPEDVLGKPFEATPWWAFSDISRQRLRTAMKDAARGIASRFEIVVQDREGRVLTMDFCLQPMHGLNGNVEFLVPSARDISERKAAEKRIRYLADYDRLTGLPNRTLLGERLAEVIRHADQHEQPVLVMLIDLDRFRLINDCLGHAAGDEVLKVAANRLTACAGERDTVARFGGDEFVMVLADDHAAASDPVGAARRVMRAFAQPIVIAGQEVYVTCSIGGAVRTDSGATEDELLKDACSALHAAKAKGGNSVYIYEPSPDIRDPERLSLESALRNALKRNELVLYYQPQVDLRSGAVIGAEALMRWWQPDRGLVLPDRFIPIAEQTGLIVPIGQWSLRVALAAVKSRRNQTSPIRHVSVNLSAHQFVREDFVQSVKRIIQETGAEPASLTLELTESMLLHDADGAMRTLTQLKDLGLRLSLDDFGTGYSSLSYLRRFPFDTIKIDRSFIRDITTDANSAAIVDATIKMAHGMRLQTVAEGVETQQQLAALRRRGCDQIQGYLFSEPLPINELATKLRGGCAFSMPPNKGSQARPARSARLEPG